MNYLIRTFIVFSLLFCFSRLLSQDKPASAEQEKMEVKKGNILELDAFHEALHPLVHDSYANKDFAAIKAALPDLIEKATALRNARLPKSLGSQTKAFRAGTKKLVTQLTNLERKKESLTDMQFGKKFMQMHDTFEKLMELTE